MRTVKELIDNYQYKNKSYHTGFKLLDDKGFEIKLSELTIIAARPGIGRTILSFNIFSNIVNDGISGAIISKEYRKNDILSYLVAASVDKPLYYILGKDLRSDKEIVDALKEIGKKNIYINDMLSLSIDEIIKNIRDMKNNDENLKIILLDERKYSEQDIYALRLLARELQLAIILNVNLSNDIEKRDDKHPRYEDIDPVIIDYADNIWILYKEEDYRKNKSILEITINKDSNNCRSIGYLIFNNTTRRVEDGTPDDILNIQNKFTKVLEISNIKEEDIKEQYLDYNDTYYTLLEDGSFYIDDELYEKNIEAIWIDEPFTLICIITKDNRIICVNDKNISKYVNNKNEKYSHILLTENYLAALTKNNELKLLTRCQCNFGVNPDNFRDVEDIIVKEVGQEYKSEELYIVKNGIEMPLFISESIR